MGRAVRMDDIKLLGETMPGDDQISYRIDIKKDLKNHSMFVAEGSACCGRMPSAISGNLWVGI